MSAGWSQKDFRVIKLILVIKAGTKSSGTTVISDFETSYDVGIEFYDAGVRFQRALLRNWIHKIPWNVLSMILPLKHLVCLRYDAFKRRKIQMIMTGS